MTQATTMNPESLPSLVRLYQSMTRWPLGKMLFAKALCLRAPYFSTIRPEVVTIEPGYASWRIKNRRRVHNHIGTVHALAMGNLAELCAGTAIEASLPSHMRWIPKGMDIRYLKKAETDLEGICDLRQTEFAPGECHVIVDIRDAHGDSVVKADINMWVSEKKSA